MIHFILYKEISIIIRIKKSKVFFNSVENLSCVLLLLLTSFLRVLIAPAVRKFQFLKWKIIKAMHVSNLYENVTFRNYGQLVLLDWTLGFSRRF
jgi:hypothetical protein